MKEPNLPDKIIDFLGLLPSTIFIFGSTSLVLHELSRLVLKTNIFLIVAIVLISSSFISWILLLLEGYIRIVWYRYKYPLRKLNKDYFLISFKGNVCLLDKKKKEMRWIKNWQTAIDLNFVGEWTGIDVHIRDPETLSSKTIYKTKDGQGFKLCDYPYVNGIHTRGK